MMGPVRPLQGGDIHRWPDGTWCFHEDLAEFEWMSDDYEVIPVGTPEWELLTGLEATC